MASSGATDNDTYGMHNEQGQGQVLNEVNLDDDDDDDDDDGCVRRGGSSLNPGMTSMLQPFGAASLMVPIAATATKQSLGSALSAGMDVSISTSNNNAAQQEKEKEDEEVVNMVEYETAASAESASLPSVLFDIPECLQVVNEESTLFGTALSGAGMSASVSAAKNDNHMGGEGVVNNNEGRGLPGLAMLAAAAADLASKMKCPTDTRLKMPLVKETPIVRSSV
jgi:hypothetical protein